ncbi:WD domain, G-beta repeat protein [Ancylostoma duodenale]|uniref:WD repeat-containing protein 44 n=1 Tax=Ancylostoma duodenale TaxID=51022 RepID=A0A0C2HCN5_9BILA|nr:WD domain, G-beta repeat protein [Ancylostoma duodenale]
MDRTVKLWHLWRNECLCCFQHVDFVTSVAFLPKDDRYFLSGSLDGKLRMWHIPDKKQLKYHTVVDVRSTRGRNAKGHKITGLAVHGDKLLVTSNDSRIRMYDVRDKALTCKFRGAQNEHSQIRAAFSPDGKHIVCGSEDKFIYLWRTADLPSTLSVRKDRNNMWERVRAHSAAVSVAVFAPKPQY